MFYNYFWKYYFTENILIKNKTTQNLLNEFFRWVENFDWYNHRVPPHQCSKSEFASNRPKEDNASAKCFAVFSTIYGQFRCSWQHWCHFVAQTTESADIGATFLIWKWKKKLGNPICQHTSYVIFYVKCDRVVSLAFNRKFWKYKFVALFFVSIEEDKKFEKTNINSEFNIHNIKIYLQRRNIF